MTYKELKKYALGHMCRSCINKVFGIQKNKLIRDDCEYNPYMGRCINCNDMRNIVSGLKLSGKVKLIKGRVPDKLKED